MCCEQGVCSGGKAKGKCSVLSGGLILFFLRTVFSQWAVTQRFPSLKAWTYILLTWLSHNR
uniref:Uncharacterized protein n=1 Tax=Anguilla anguilla TaxID=7936 RepID=A0A0E9QHE9_ANGAN